MDQRWPPAPSLVRARRESRRVVVNAGLWLGDPDVDAVTRLCNDISAVRYTREASFALARRTWLCCSIIFSCSHCLNTFVFQVPVQLSKHCLVARYHTSLLSQVIACIFYAKGQ